MFENHIDIAANEELLAGAEMDDLAAARFAKRLETDFGVRASFARWAVYEWFHCYGERVLQKPGSLQPAVF